MPYTIHIIVSEKGGVGKTFFSLLLYYTMLKNISTIERIIFIDMNPMNPDLYRIFKKVPGIRIEESSIGGYQFTRLNYIEPENKEITLYYPRLISSQYRTVIPIHVFYDIILNFCKQLSDTNVHLLVDTNLDLVPLISFLDLELSNRCYDVSCIVINRRIFNNIRRELKESLETWHKDLYDYVFPYMIVWYILTDGIIIKNLRDDLRNTIRHFEEHIKKNLPALRYVYVFNPASIMNEIRGWFHPSQTSRFILEEDVFNRIDFDGTLIESFVDIFSDDLLNELEKFFRDRGADVEQYLDEIERKFTIYIENKFSRGLSRQQIVLPRNFFIIPAFYKWLVNFRNRLLSSAQRDEVVSIAELFYDVIFRSGYNERKIRDEFNTLHNKLKILLKYLI